MYVQYRLLEQPEVRFHPRVVKIDAHNTSADSSSQASHGRVLVRILPLPSAVLVLLRWYKSEIGCTGTGFQKLKSSSTLYVSMI